MKLIYVTLLIIPLFYACKEEVEDDELGKVEVPSVKNDPTISTDFSTNSFSSDVEKKLLEEIKICNPKETNDKDVSLSACSPKLFRFFPLAKNIPLNDGFILLIKAGVGRNNLRRTLIFQREKGTLVKVNGFMANLIERRPSSTGFEDLILRFPDRNESSLIYYNCLFQWKEGKYQFISCEDIDEGAARKVKAEFKDSMAIVIKSILVKNNMLF